MAERGRVGCVVESAVESVVGDDRLNSLTAFGDGGGELSVIVMIHRQRRHKIRSINRLRRFC